MELYCISKRGKPASTELEEICQELKGNRPIQNTQIGMKSPTEVERGRTVQEENILLLK